MFGFFYPVSKEIVRKQGYLDKLLGFDTDNSKTKEQFRELKTIMTTYLK